MIEILSGGAINAVQDLGREGWQAIGVSRGGAMDAHALATANAMVGNDDGAAGLEIALFPFRMQFRRDAYFACTGARVSWKLGRLERTGWWAAPARAGDTLTLEMPQAGARAYLAFSGGIDVPCVLGSRATDLKGGFGGYKGRGLRKGDLVPLADRERPRERPVGTTSSVRSSFWEEAIAGCATVRVLPAAEYGEFTPEARAAFEATEYRLTTDSNRQGYRLQGPELAMTARRELLSHGILPGTVQVPASGQPIIQLAEANTCGGYPKIANVIEADLWRLGQLRPGQRIRFARTDHSSAVAALAELAAEHARIRDGLAFHSGHRRRQ
ncbi:biotin-dependent carboxyltransferase family protein [Ramlibacter sp.]|uniref:5-oxoprolinase subunit C family protein n=1 Tax=Ramlibacter sp. TaxID=1917967 RepID=UPI003D1345A8